MNIAEIMMRRFADEQWAYDGGGYSGLSWFSESPKPTEEELIALWADVYIEVETERAEKARQIAYQKTSDPLFFEFQRGNATKQEWLDAVQAVRDQYPYPEEVVES